MGDKTKNKFLLSFLIFQKTLLSFANIGLRTSFINLQVLLIKGTKQQSTLYRRKRWLN